MSTVVLLATELPADGGPLLELIAQLQREVTVAGVPLRRVVAGVEVVVLTRPGREAGLQDAEVVETGEVAGWLAARVRAQPPGTGVVVLPANAVVDDLSLGRIADPAARGTAALHRHGAVEVGYSRVVGPRVGEVLGLRLAGGDEQVAAALERGDEAAGERGDGAEPQELLAWLTAVLLRAEIVVGSTPLPEGGVWELPCDEAEVAAARAARDRLDLDRLRMDAAVKREDGFFTTFLVSSYSRYLARWAARRGLSPDLVTLASGLVGIAAAVAFAAGNLAGLVVGAVLLQAAFTLDCVDGQLARMTRSFTTWGAWLDSIGDRGKEVVVYLGLALGAVRAGEDAAVIWVLAGLALTLQTFRHTLDLGYAEAQQARMTATARTAWVAREDGTPRSAGGGGAIPARMVAALRRAEAVAVLRWAKRIVVLPIGERFALISVVAVLAGPRMVFIALLGWGTLAMLYTLTGRVVRSFA